MARHPLVPYSVKAVIKNKKQGTYASLPVISGVRYKTSPKVLQYHIAVLLTNLLQ